MKNRWIVYKHSFEKKNNPSLRQKSNFDGQIIKRKHEENEILEIHNFGNGRREKDFTKRVN